MRNNNIPALSLYNACNAYNVTQASIEKALQKLSIDLQISSATYDALTEIHSMLKRMHKLAVQAAANDALTSQDRERIQLEIDKLKDGIDLVARAQLNKRPFCN